ncbi:50S ribosomal protein L11 methyltransferase [Pigmentibacter sp. JX0631]|uniref:50S ribosomal protein L11 methyltransferase n=1 Tax=Pigmentibacter sp. JX0631 TaxID=2976982 RepID=UPI0024695F92|nr:50S ribosomal protein L11 methyltransferase [Pigmentibacter sp. JX0631]WGL60888.1 50S ribosomal protein L11 methyltransferase [Pigmentibacter sp. JX0631]
MNISNAVCYELAIFIAEEHKDLLASILQQLGIENFVIGSIDCDIPAEYNPNFPRPDFYSELAERTPALIYSEDFEYLQSIQNSLEYVFQSIHFPFDSNTFQIKPISDQNWRESWKASFKPILLADKIAILPPWEKVEQFTQQHKIIIDPGMAFGTGQHETTKLCMTAMLNYPIPKSVLDVGTGSGILAIAAKMLGAEYVLGTDLDPDCLKIATENAKVNHVTEIEFIIDHLVKIEKNDFQMVLANIESKPLQTIMQAICDHANRNAIIILSGILVSEMNDFKNFMKQFQTNFLNDYILGDWCSLVYQKKN